MMFPTNSISLHKNIVFLASKWLKKHNQNIVVPNCSILTSELASLNATREIPDIIGWNYWTSVMIEVKVSRSDFLRDSKKIFRKNPESGVGELRY